MLHLYKTNACTSTWGGNVQSSDNSSCFGGRKWGPDIDGWMRLSFVSLGPLSLFASLVPVLVAVKLEAVGSSWGWLAVGPSLLGDSGAALYSAWRWLSMEVRRPRPQVLYHLLNLLYSPCSSGYNSCLEIILIWMIMLWPHKVVMRITWRWYVWSITISKGLCILGVQLDPSGTVHHCLLETPPVRPLLSRCLSQSPSFSKYLRRVWSCLMSGDRDVQDWQYS